MTQKTTVRFVGGPYAGKVRDVAGELTPIDVVGWDGRGEYPQGTYWPDLSRLSEEPVPLTWREEEK